jgi:hypothetical protein
MAASCERRRELQEVHPLILADRLDHGDGTVVAQNLALAVTRSR